MGKKYNCTNMFERTQMSSKKNITELVYKRVAQAAREPRSTRKGTSWRESRAGFTHVLVKCRSTRRAAPTDAGVTTTAYPQHLRAEQG